MCLYLTSLAVGTPPLRYTTIKNYTAGLNSIHGEYGYYDWLDTCPLTSRLLKGIKRVLGSKSELQRKPITTTLLDHMHTLINPNAYAHLVYWAAATTATYGLLRLGEFCVQGGTAETCDNHALLTVHQIALFTAKQQRVPTFSSGQYASVAYYAVTLRRSKTDPFRKGVTILIGHPVPVAAMLAYLSVHRDRHVDKPSYTAPLFIYGDAALTRTRMIEITRCLLTALGYDGSTFFGHSFRRGGATSLATKGVDDRMIQALGRWSSDCYKLYIDTPIDKLLLCNRMM